MLNMPKAKIEYVEDLNEINYVNIYIYNRGNGRKTAYLHYTDGMMIYEQSPGLWKGWRLMLKLTGDREFLLQEQE